MTAGERSLGRGFQFVNRSTAKLALELERTKSSVLWRKKARPEQSPVKLLLWTAVAGLMFGLIGFGEVLEDLLRSTRNSLHPHKASGEIVLVKIDDASLREIGRWPWPRRYHAQLTDRLSEAGAKRIFFDIMFENASEGPDDRIFAEAIKRSGKVTLAVRARTGRRQGTSPNAMPLPKLAGGAQLGSISANYNYHNSVWKLPFAERIGNRIIPTYASKLADAPAEPGKTFMIDYSVDPHSVPGVSASAVLNGSMSKDKVAGRDVVIGVATDALGDRYFLPGWGQMPGSYVQILAAETLKAGQPMMFGWVPAFVLALIAAAVAVTRKRPLQQNLVLAGAALVVLGGPMALEAYLIFADITPALLVLIVVGSAMGWRKFRAKGLVHAASGLPNLAALRANRPGRSQALIAARILNYAEIVASLPAEGERHLIDQIVSRLRVGAPERTLYHGDGGIFAWFDETRVPFGNHLEALCALFRGPARVHGQPIDLSISFGVEIGSSRSLANRLASALVAAEEAAHDGLKWKYHDPESLQDASWKLSMLSQLDSAVDKGEVWVAYQPKLELATGKIIGAEALARWTHPEKGPIAASEFVAAAEQHDRIGKLTDFVLEQAIAAAAGINRGTADFSMAVNLSARLLSDKGFTLRLTAMLARHGLPARLLTLELTETAALAGSGSAIDMLASLRELGVSISIDDYGTGLSTLEYLKKIPADEIKIDQSFVKGMLDNRSDRLMVQSTIGLAHSLGRRIVAEGVERREILDALEEMQCDAAQGFIIGRPMSLESLAKRIKGSRKSRVA